MRKSLTIGLAVASCVLAAPVVAQQQQPSNTGNILGRVLDRLLGPEEKPVAETTPTPVATAEMTTMQQVLADPRRNDDRARDTYRHPAETLDFFQVRPGMTVVDYMPSSGWYTRVLVPYLGRSGTYIGLNPDIDENATGFFASMRNYDRTLPGQVSETFGNSGARPIGVNVNNVPESLHGTVDRVVIFREIHNMRRFNWFYDSMHDIRALLKDDGLVGVVQHRAKANAPAAYTDGSKGYQRQQDVIDLFRVHGFELVASSEINANTNDPADWPNGVWTLPPVYGGADEDSRPRLEAIGESDRMTLLFRKRP